MAYGAWLSRGPRPQLTATDGYVDSYALGTRGYLWRGMTEYRTLMVSPLQCRGI